MFPTQEQLITYVETVFVTPKTPDAKGTPLAVGHLITFVDQDTSGDKRLSPTDSMSVLAIGPDGENAKVILSGLTTTPRIRTLDGSSVVLFFETAKGAHSVVYDLAQGALGTVFPLAQPSQFTVRPLVGRILSGCKAPLGAFPLCPAIPRC